MRVHVLQHVPFEGLGSIEPWLAGRSAEIRYTRFFDRDPLPDLDAVDLLVAMGGPMSVNDEAQFSWLEPEKRTVHAAIDREIPVLGICLGAQLIASALGARVYRNAVKEIGWLPIQGIHATEGSFRFPPQCTVFHWHGETFDLPVGAVRLARSAGCENQAFQLNRHVIGLQFHLETTAAAAHGMVENCGDELVPGPFVQGAREILDVPAARYQAINGLMADVLAHLLDPRPAQQTQPPAA